MKKIVFYRRKNTKQKVASRQGRSVAYEVAEQLQELIPNEIRVALAGHIQRGGNPCSYDRFMATRFGGIWGQIFF